MKTKGRQETSLTINKIILKSKEKAGKKERNKKKLLTPQSIQNHSHRKTTRTIRPKARIENQNELGTAEKDILQWKNRNLTKNL